MDKEIIMGCCEPMLGPIEAYYTKFTIDRKLEEITSAITSGCCITPEEVDEKIEQAVSGITVSGVTEEQLNEAIASAKTQIEAEIPTVPTKVSAFENDVPYLTEHQSLSGYATEQWVEDKHYITGVDLSDYALKSELPVVPTSNTAFTNDAGYLTEHQSLSGYATEAFVSAFTYDKATIDEKVAGGGSFDPSQYYNKTATDELLAEKLDVTAYTPVDLSNYYTTGETVNLVESAVTRVEGEIPTVPTSNTAFTNDAGYLTEHQSLSGYATEQWVEDKHYITGVDLSDYALKSELPVVPTSNTAFTNDAGYLTEHQSLSGYATEQWVEDKHYITGVDLSNYATTGDVNNVSTALTSHTSNTTIHVTPEQVSNWNAKSDFSGSYNDLTDKPTIPTVPTDISAFNNDVGYITGVDLSNYATKDNLTAATDDMATKTWVNNQGYLTEHQSLSAYSTTDEVNSSITQAVSGKVDTNIYTAYTAATDTALSGKQETLVSGTNIKTINNQSLLGSGNIDIQGGGGVTIDPTLDSGSTNPVANSAITEAVLVPNYRQLVKAEDRVVFPNASALYIEAINLEGYYNIYLSGSSSETQRLYVTSFAQHMIDGELSYVNYEWQTDNSLILTPKTSGNYFYMVNDTWNKENVYAIYDFASGTSSSVIQNEIYPRIIDLEVKVVNLKDTKVTNVSYNPLYMDYGGYWYHEIEVYDNVGGRYTALAKLKYDDFGYDNNDGIIYTKKTSGVTSGSTECLTSGGAYQALSAKPNVWCGSEADWAQISGGTLDNNCIYLVY